MAVAEKLHAPQVPDRPGASWTNGWRIGQEVLMSGMTAHPVLQPTTPGAYDQTLVVLKKLEALVTAAGGHKHNIVKTVVYLTDITDKDEVGRARKDFFEGHYPCSTLVTVSALAFPELRVEIDAWARLDVDLRQASTLSTES
jgi:2-iminobutanoate/2-iminopropanoate deaminase